jgi:hypothetical protein
VSKKKKAFVKAEVKLQGVVRQSELTKSVLMKDVSNRGLNMIEGIRTSDFYAMSWSARRKMSCCTKKLLAIGFRTKVWV